MNESNLRSTKVTGAFLKRQGAKLDLAPWFEMYPFAADMLRHVIQVNLEPLRGMPEIVRARQTEILANIADVLQTADQYADDFFGDDQIPEFMIAALGGMTLNLKSYDIDEYQNDFAYDIANTLAALENVEELHQKKLTGELKANDPCFDLAKNGHPVGVFICMVQIHQRLKASVADVKKRHHLYINNDQTDDKVKTAMYLLKLAPAFTWPATKLAEENASLLQSLEFFTRQPANLPTKLRL